MKDPGCDPDLDRLAEDWIALWQGELAAMAEDPELAGLWRQAMATGAAWLRATAAGPPSHPPAWPGGAPSSPPGGAAPGDAREQPGGTPAGSAPAAAAPGTDDAALPGGAGAVDTAALWVRLAELERRLAALEGGAGGDGANRRKPRRRRPSA